MKSKGLTAGLVAVLVVVTLALASTTCVWAGGGGLEAMTLGRGAAGLAIWDGPTTGSYNPALLGRGAFNWLEPPPVVANPGGDWWVGEIGASRSEDTKGVALSTSRIGEHYGWGIQWGEEGDRRDFSLEYGARLCRTPGDNGWFYGVDVRVPQCPDFTDSVTVGAGLLYTNQVKLVEPGIWSFALRGDNIVSNSKHDRSFTWDGGLGLTYPRARLAFDVLDISDQRNRSWNAGAEYDACKHLTLRIGDRNHDFTWGGSLKVKRLSFDFGREELSPGHYDMFGLRYCTSW